MAYNAKAIANYFFDVAKEHRQSISPMKMQKLVYFAHGWYLAIKNEPLIDEQVEAWQFGPVIPSLYQEFKSYGKSEITAYATEFTGLSLATLSLETPRIPDTQDLKDFLNKIWEVYGGLTAIQLSNLTHQCDTPWRKTWGENGVPKGTDINSDEIRAYFRSQAN
ncbi:MAG: type II toxin-antitoxin system antitoxin SocA domain-containing protein [Pseudomonadota bacterium]